MLDEYICLKEQKMFVDQEKSRLEQEKFRVQTLLRGMQDVMNAYNFASAAAPLTSPMVIPALPPANTMASPAVTRSTSNSLSQPTNFSATTTGQSALKRRKTTEDVSGSLLASKRSRTQPPTKEVKSSEK